MEWDELEGCAGRFFGSAWICANSAFAPQHAFLGEQDEQIELLYKARSVIGAIIITYAAVYYDRIHGVPEAFGAIEDNVNWTVLFCFLAMIPAGLAMILFTKPESRMDAFLQLRYPGIACGTYLGISLALSVSGRLVSVSGDSFLTAMIGGIVVIVFLVWFLVFLCRATYLMATGLLRLGDGHPLLPPAIGTIAAWALATKSLATDGISGGEPAIVTLALLLGGPASITVLAVFECLRLRDEYPDDFPFRAGPLNPTRK